MGCAARASYGNPCMAGAGARDGLPCRAFLGVALLAGEVAAQSGTNEPESISPGGDDSEFVSNVTVYVTALGVILLLCTCTACALKLKERYQTLGEEEEEVEPIREWCYKLPSGEICGPHSNDEMRELFLQGKLKLVKLVWQDSFLEVNEHFPHPGSEFVKRARPSVGAAHAEWHRYSVHSQSSLALAPMAWYYKNPKGSIEGPFETGKMRHWLMEGFFDTSLQVRLGDEDGPFFAIREFFPKEDEAFAVKPKLPSGGMPCAESMRAELKKATSRASLSISSAQVTLELTGSKEATTRRTDGAQVLGHKIESE